MLIADVVGLPQQVVEQSDLRLVCRCEIRVAALRAVRTILRAIPGQKRLAQTGTRGAITAIFPRDTGSPALSVFTSPGRRTGTARQSPRDR